ncbi:MAG: amino acid decarboxylase [Clostridia bacterium]|nr:amino acid decarboxylase [Clostridia bacterium]
MTTPIYDFVTRYLHRGGPRFHMPGHKGSPHLGCEERDITEIDGADVLYAPDGIIAESEDNASALFGTSHTFYSAEGSTLAIKAMLALVSAKARAEGTRPFVLAGRNAHKAFLYACALLDLEAGWLYGEGGEHICSCTLTAKAVEEALTSVPTLPCAVYITSPDYLGRESDVAGIARVCHSFGVPLLVDNAHGAYLQFLSPSRHPIALGATICCDSAHKTLPVLTGGAYLHLSHSGAERFSAEEVRRALSLFASTSPSYLILQSLDLCNRTLSEDYGERLTACAERAEQMRAVLRGEGYRVAHTEPLKVTVDGRPLGYTGLALASALRERGAEAEFADEEQVVLMVTPETEEAHWELLAEVLCSLPKQAPLREEEAFCLPCGGEQRMTIRQAMLSPCEWVETKAAVGRICASPTVSCPPAVPLAVSGERITEESAALFLRYGFERICVVR